MRPRGLTFIRTSMPSIVAFCVGLTTIAAVFATLRPPARDSQVMWVTMLIVMFAVAFGAALAQQRIANAEQYQADTQRLRIERRLWELHDRWLAIRVLEGEKAAAAATLAPEQPRVIIRYENKGTVGSAPLVIQNFSATAFDVRIEDLVLSDDLTVKFDVIPQLDAEGVRIEPRILERGEPTRVHMALPSALKSAYENRWREALVTIVEGDALDRFFKPASWSVVVRSRDASGAESISVHRLDFDMMDAATMVFLRYERGEGGRGLRRRTVTQDTDLSLAN